jgi:hypothetical protein
LKPSNTHVLGGPEPSNQTGKKLTFCSETVQRMRQLRLGLSWVQEGYIYPFPPFAQCWDGLPNALKISARIAVASPTATIMSNHYLIMRYQ